MEAQALLKKIISKTVSEFFENEDFSNEEILIIDHFASVLLTKLEKESGT